MGLRVSENVNYRSFAARQLLLIFTERAFKAGELFAGIVVNNGELWDIEILLLLV